MERGRYRFQTTYEELKQDTANQEILKGLDSRFQTTYEELKPSREEWFLQLRAL